MKHEEYGLLQTLSKPSILGESITSIFRVKEASSKIPAACLPHSPAFFFFFFGLAYSLTLKMEVIRSSETSGCLQTAQKIFSSSSSNDLPFESI
jgi:hypothetical protein